MLIDRHIADIAARLSLDPKDLMLLYALRRSGKPYCMRPTDIFRLLSVTSGAATYRADKLVERGVARRISDPEDRRSQLIQLTEAGLELVDIAITELANTSLNCLKYIPKDDDSIDILNRMLGLLEAGWLSETPAEENPLSRSERAQKIKKPSASES
ncbi:Multiple antibiotic resistance protein MarR [compost metagenome]